MKKQEALVVVEQQQKAISWDEIAAAEGGIDVASNGSDGRIYLTKEQWLLKGVNVKAKLRFSDASKTQDGISKPFLGVMFGGKFHSAYLSTAVKSLLEEGDYLSEGASLKHFAEMLTLAVGVAEYDGKMQRTFQICISGGGDL